MIYTRIFLAILITIMASQLFSQDCEKLEAEGRFSSKDEEAADSVKKELIYDAYRNLLTKQMNCMGLDAKLFWDKFDLEFEKSFESIKEEIRKSFLIKENGKEKIKDPAEFEKKVNTRKLVARREFGSIDRLIISYSIDKMSRSTQYPGDRFISISGKIDTKALGDLYYKFTDLKQKRQVDQIFLSAQVKLKELSWSNLGVKTEAEFMDSIKDSWMKWVMNNWGRSFSTLYLLHDRAISEIETIDSFLSGEKSPFTVAVVKNMSTTQSPQDTTLSGVKINPNSLWIHFSINLKMTQDNRVLNKREIEFSGNYVLKDLLTGEVVGHYDFPLERKQYFLDEVKDFASTVATYIYNIPLSSMSNDTKKISTLTVSENKVTLEIENVSSIRDILAFNEELANKGAKFQLRPTLDSYAGDKGQLVLFYQGSLEELKSFLVGLKNSKISTEKVITFENVDNPLVMKLIQTP